MHVLFSARGNSRRTQTDAAPGTQRPLLFKAGAVFFAQRGVRAHPAGPPTCAGLPRPPDRPAIMRPYLTRALPRRVLPPACVFHHGKPKNTRLQNIFINVRLPYSPAAAIVTVIFWKPLYKYNLRLYNI